METPTPDPVAPAIAVASLAPDQWLVIVVAVALVAFVAGVVIPQLWK